MNVIDFAAYRAFKPREDNNIESENAPAERSDELVTIAFTGEPDEIIDATLAWIAALDEEDENFGMWSDPVMVVEKGSISFIGYDEGDTSWRAMLCEGLRAWQFKEAEIFEIAVLAKIIVDYRADLSCLLREGYDKESWMNEFLVVMNYDKCDYYANGRL